MAAMLKATWPAFSGAASVDFTVFRAGSELYKIGLSGEATEQEFFAADYPDITYAAHAEGRYSAYPCEIEEVDEGGGGSGSGTGGGA